MHWRAVATNCARHAQVCQTSQAAEAEWNGAAELLVAEPAESSSGTPQRCVRRHSTRRTHRYCNPVMLPRLDGMVPLSWLPSSKLRAQADASACARATRSAAHIQVVRPSQITQARWDGAAELVASEIAESPGGCLSTVQGRPAARRTYK